MKEVIQVKSLRKQYGSKTVLDGISFSVKKGEMFALLGTNGAGKTTTLECMEGVRRYQSGHIALQGRIGVQLQSSSLPENIKAFEALKLFSKWSRSAIPSKLVSTLKLEPLKNKQYREMSTGQKRRLHLALAMTGDPDILFLDEPTAGLDVEGRVALHEQIREFKRQGKTIILASHDMAEVESLCDTIAILREGQIVFMGTAAELTAQAKDIYRVQLKLSAPLQAESLSHSTACDAAQGYQGFETRHLNDGLIELLSRAKDQGIVVTDIRVDHATLEQRFIDIAKEESK